MEFKGQTTETAEICGCDDEKDLLGPACRPKTQALFRFNINAVIYMLLGFLWEPGLATRENDGPLEKSVKIEWDSNHINNYYIN